MKVVLAGEGAIARKHASAISGIDGVEIVSLLGGGAESTAAFAKDHRIPHWSLDMDECLQWPDVEAVVLATPTPLHAMQAMRCLQAGKHVLVEIPVAESLEDAHAVAAVAAETNREVMVCHTRRFNPSHRWIHENVVSGDLSVQHLMVRTGFFRRENRNALGQLRSWTDNLLWHHACHSVDLFMFQTGQAPEKLSALQGPTHPELGIPMDMSIGLATADGSLCTVALSFNQDGPFGTTFRYVCDNGTFIASYDDLTDGFGNHVDVSSGRASNDGIVLQDLEFFEAISEGRAPEANVGEVLPTMEVIDRIQKVISRGFVMEGDLHDQ